MAGFFPSDSDSIGWKRNGARERGHRLRRGRPHRRLQHEAQADVVLAGHYHAYERFAPQAPDGRTDGLRGIRQFVVGMGGTKLRPMEDRVANSEVVSDGTHGVLNLTLAPGAYRWEFIPVAGRTFTDEGTGRCH